MSQRQLARRAGMTQASVSRIERGVVSPSVATLVRLLRECGVDLVAVPLRGDVDRTVIRERIPLTPAQRGRLAVAEWRGVVPLLGLARARV